MLASETDLAELLYPLGLFNQRANSLIRFSQQYIQLGWPIGTTGSPMPSPLDVRVFYGAGRYASDSFRIFSTLLPGNGAPEKEQYWLDKRSRALERMRRARDIGTEDGDGLEVGEYTSAVDDEADKEEEEWRKVQPTGRFLYRIEEN